MCMFNVFFYDPQTEPFHWVVMTWRVNYLAGCIYRKVFLRPFYFSEACSLMVSQLLPVEEAEHDEWLEKVIENIQKQSLVSPVLEKQHIELAIQVMIFTSSS